MQVWPLFTGVESGLDIGIKSALVAVAQGFFKYICYGTVMRVVSESQNAALLMGVNVH